jgi:flagellar hook-associated protein 2
LRITDAAEKARIIGDNSLQASTTIDASNNELTIKLDSTTEATVTLAEGVYTPQELADHLETVILNSKDLGGRKLSASVQDGKLELTSNTYGNSSKISIVRGSAVATLGLSDGQSDSGLDVIGEFVFNPGTDDEYIEKAEGRGQVLIGRAKSEIADKDPIKGATEGLQLRVTLTPAQVEQMRVDESMIDVTFTRGVASKLSNAITSILKTDGKLDQINDAFKARIQSVDDSITRLNNQFESRRESLTVQFARLESIVGELQGAGNLLSAQLSSIPQF